MVVKQIEGIGHDIMTQRYLYPGEKTWGDRARVIARTIARAEKDDEKPKWERKFFDTIASGDLVPGGRIIYGSGRSRQNLLNCYQVSPDDNVNSIAKLLSDVYKISCGGGGIGFSFSNIRPKGDDIQNIPNSAPGAVSVIKMINAIGDQVKAGKNRRTALLASLSVRHPDILDFLHVKLDKKELNNFNISVEIDDEFLQACNGDEEWSFRYNNKDYYVYQVERFNSRRKTRETINIVALSAEDALGRGANHYLVNGDDLFENAIRYPLRAKELWNTIWKNAVEAGCPGILNMGFANSYTNVSYFEKLMSSNPCGEQTLPNYGNCCLANINLSNMAKDNDVDWPRLATAVRTGIRFLDNVLTENYFPIEECREVGHKSRRIGLGVMGLHYMLVKLNLRYGSEKCLEFLERLFSTIRNEAYLASIYLAEEKGSFPAFDVNKFLNEEFAKTLPPRIRMLIKQKGIRNAVLLTCPPTGTISMVMGTSTGIEPIFAPIYKRRYRKGNAWAEEIIVDPLLKEFFLAGTEFSRLKDIFVGAYDVTPSEHMAVQATIQKFIDSALSKTINLPSTATAEEFSDTALIYASNLKGLTVYREGSKENAPLVPIELTEEVLKSYVNTDVQTQVSDGAACTIGSGECGA